MRNALNIWMRLLLAGAMALALSPPASARKGKHPPISRKFFRR